MPLFSAPERGLAEAIGAMSYANPFLPERVELERRALGPGYVEVGGAKTLLEEGDNPNSAVLLARAEELLAAGRARPGRWAGAGEAELELYQAVALFALYHRWRDELARLTQRGGEAGARALRVPWYGRFREQAVELLRPGGRRLPVDLEPAHLLALFFQVARAFHHIYAFLLGTSPAAVRLRATVWESIFTHDIRRYQRSLYLHMADLATLVTGPSGTGKELVAQAVGRSGYVAFDEGRQAFPVAFEGLFLPLNLSSLSPTLIESELFGHRRGAFTGALQDREGWFEICHPSGAVFLDEIGDIAPEIQTKLLRVLQTRAFQRLGETSQRVFRGKLISATNRDLSEELARGRFREDLYYRICSDRIVTPSLAEQMQGSPEELERLVRFVARRLVGEEAAELARDVVAWVERELGHDYPWPGNFRELEQCVRNVLVRREYRPQAPSPASVPTAPVAELLEQVGRGALTAEELLGRYCALVYARAGSYEGAARALGLDRRTVRARVDQAWLARLGAGRSTVE